MGRIKLTMNISISKETKERLQQIARENHMTMSQALTMMIWHHPVSTDDQQQKAGANNDGRN